MSIDFYFAGNPNEPVMDYLVEHNYNRLLSYAIEKTSIKKYISIKDSVEEIPLFFDSGAFSAWSKGKSINVDEYIDFLNENMDIIKLCASVDSIPGELNRKPTVKELQNSPIQSWDNYLYMRERIKDKDKLLPVFHLGEDFKHLDNMLNTKLDGKYIPYIALGGTVGSNSKVKSDWYNTCFKVIRESNNPTVKTHAFGMTSMKLLETYPFTSCDSTSWVMLGATGGIYTKYGVVYLTERSANKPTYIGNLDTSIAKNIEKEINNCNLDIQQCINDHKSRMIVNINYLQDWASKYTYKGTKTYQKRLF